MLRSEEHAPDGGLAPLDAFWPATQRWYGNRLDPDFRPATVDDLQTILTDAGLTTPFWSLS